MGALGRPMSLTCRPRRSKRIDRGTAAAWNWRPRGFDLFKAKRVEIPGRETNGAAEDGVRSGPNRLKRPRIDLVLPSEG